MKKKACKICNMIVDGDHCPDHPDTPLSEDIKGKIIIVDKEKSDVAKHRKHTKNADYAIKVR